MQAIVNHRLRFVDEDGDHTLIPSPVSQVLPERFVNHPYCKAAQASGWIVLVAEPEKEAATTEDPIVPVEEKRKAGRPRKNAADVS